MADDIDDSMARGGGSDPLAIHIAAAASGPAAEEARVYLREHADLARLQKQNLSEQNAFELSHLRWRRFNDQMRGALQLLIFAIVAAIVIALFAVVWDASEANGLIIESFSVPPDMAAQGITGQVVADKLLDQLNALQRATTSSRSGAGFSSDWTNDIKVEIPDTGISLGEAYRLVRNWLGNDTRLSGEVYEAGGSLYVMARLSGGAAQTFKGKPGDLDSLVRTAAEALFRAAQPYRYAMYLFHRGRAAESNAIFRVLTRDPSPVERAWAYGALSNFDWATGRYDEATVLMKHALAIEPDLIVSYAGLGLIARDQSHPEDELVTLREAAAHFRAGARLQDARTMLVESAEWKEITSELSGDYQAAISQLRIEAESGAAYTGPDDLAAAAGDAALGHDIAGADALLKEWQLAKELAGEPTEHSDAAAWARALRAEVQGQWQRAIEESNVVELLLLKEDAAEPGVVIGHAFLKTSVLPRRAVDHARLGNFGTAHAEIDGTAFDCYDCVRARGNIRAAEKDWNAGAFWFADAVKQAPDIPFAYSDWGAMLLHEGRYDAAIEKFREANLKGPHFADPLEMWGEALMAKNRSDLALAKFEEANKYAPNWGRLHLKWGEALFYAGHPDVSKKQIAMAAGLDLSVWDKAALASWTNAHG